MSYPSKVHWQAVKWLLRYLNGSSNLVLVYGNNKADGSYIKGYCDANYAADLDKRRFIIGYAFTVGRNQICWKSTRQHIVALSTIEVEYMALIEAIKEAIWLKGITTELGLKVNSLTVYYDSQSAIHLSKNTMFHERTNHIAVRLHFVRGIVSQGIVKDEKISTLSNLADMLTKTIPIGKFEQALNLLNVLTT